MGSVLQKLHLVRTQRQSDLMLRITKTLAGQRIEHVVSTICDVADQLLEAEKVTLYLVHSDLDELEVFNVMSPLVGKRFQMSTGLAGLCARTGLGVNVVDAQTHLSFDPSFDELSAMHTHSVVCQPIKNAQSKVIAVIEAINAKVSCGSCFCTNSQESK